MSPCMSLMESITEGNMRLDLEGVQNQETLAKRSVTEVGAGKSERTRVFDYYSISTLYQ